MTSLSEIDPRYTVADLAYIAGLFDGEGSISLRLFPRQTKRYGKRTYYILAVGIANCRRDALEWVQNTMDIGGRISSKWSSNKGYFRNYVCYRLDYNNARAIRFLELVSPFLKIKKEEADLVLEFYRRCIRPGSHHITPQEQEKREEMRIRLLELKNAKLTAIA